MLSGVGPADGRRVGTVRVGGRERVRETLGDVGGGDAGGDGGAADDLGGRGRVRSGTGDHEALEVEAELEENGAFDHKTSPMGQPIEKHLIYQPVIMLILLLGSSCKYTEKYTDSSAWSCLNAIHST